MLAGRHDKRALIPRPVFTVLADTVVVSALTLPRTGVVVEPTGLSSMVTGRHRLALNVVFQDPHQSDCSFNNDNEIFKKGEPLT